MHNLYKEKCIEDNKTPVSFEKYKRIFREYKLKFHKSKKDRCKKCIAHGEQKSDAGYDDTLFKEHCERKEAARKIRDKDKEDAKSNESVLAIQSDLQAVLNTPKGASGPFSYVRKFAVYNLTIYNLKDASATCCVWDETEGNRSSKEVSTCIYKFLMSQTNVEFVIIMSDSCGGQQINSQFISMIMHVIKEHPSIKQIDRRFFEP